MRKPVFRYLTAILIALALIGPLSAFAADAEPQKERPDTLYIIPFLNVMVPAELSSTLFDTFIDNMMQFGVSTGTQLRILKQDIDLIDKTWLAQQQFVTGEVFDYLKDSGCCSTELHAKARIYLYRPGNTDPAAVIVVPEEVFFDHDLSTLAKERVRLGKRLAKKLVGKLTEEIRPAR